MSITTNTGERPMTMKNPPHPGTVVFQECIEPLGLGQLKKRRFTYTKRR